ncbi:poly(R)-hydroxyalkanoic acid synthase subunit PhaE [Desulfococcus sp.]|uniref:poly(R)-hydroxyalkanoic acid synthase subunit PhaE n=1 Tax=Desulfococcus sp. TaxID=2025834 RepID=UPI0035945A28
MAENKKTETDPAAWMNAWTKSTTDFWRQMLGAQAGAGSEKFGKNPASQAQKMLLSGGKMLHLMIAKLSDPETINAVLQGMDTLPETSMSMIQQGVNSYVEMQKQWTEQVSRMGRHTEAYKFEGIDENVFKSWKETYEKEFQKFFNIPALGLTRFYQERINRFMDETSQFQVALSEFLYLFSVPFEKTAKVMQEKTEEMMEKGDVPSDVKEYYNMYIKILEGHYMTLLQSPEYIRVMSDTINALVKYKQAREEVLCDMLNTLPIPTNKEMDELYKEFHVLKKRVREQDKRLDRLEEAILPQE